MYVYHARGQQSQQNANSQGKGAAPQNGVKQSIKAKAKGR